MAFEDRCSPNQANSPGPDPNKTPSPDASNLNPNDRHLKPYTCNIITKHERSSSPIDGTKQIFYSPYYAGYYNIYDPLNQYLIQKAPSQESRERSPQRDERPMDLNFSISNILRPEFGLTAIKKTTNKKEGPRSGGPTQSILYKPYELKLDRVQKVDSPNAPLGRLSRAVASIAQTKKEDFPARVSREEFGFSKADTAQKRPDSANSSISTASSSVSSQGAARGAGGYATGSDDGSTKSLPSTADKSGNQQWPAWVFCTRYSDRPSSGPRSRRSKKKETSTVEDKRPRTAFSGSQLARLKQEFTENRYLTERRRQQLSSELGLNEAQIKIWFQNKRAKIKKSSGQKHPLALQLMAQGLYNHTTASGSEDEDEISVT